MKTTKPTSFESAPNIHDRVNEDARQKREIARYVSANLVTPRMRLFLSSGSTCLAIAEALFLSHEGLHVATHSLLIACRYVELHREDRIRSGTELEIIGGRLNSQTGATQHPERNLHGINASMAFISPHGISPGIVYGDLDVEDLRQVIKCHSRIVFVATFHAFLRTGRTVMKHTGHMEKEIRSGRRDYTLVLPQTIPADVRQAEREKIRDCLNVLQQQGVRIVGNESIRF